MIPKIILILVFSAIMLWVISLGIKLVKGRLDLMYFYVRGISLDFNAIKKEDLPKLSKWYGWALIIYSSITVIGFPFMVFGIFDGMLTLGIFIGMSVFVFISVFVVYRMHAKR